jgi:hypothetical protein
MKLVSGGYAQPPKPESCLSLYSGVPGVNLAGIVLLRFPFTLHLPLALCLRRSPTNFLHTLHTGMGCSRSS